MVLNDILSGQSTFASFILCFYIIFFTLTHCIHWIRNVKLSVQHLWRTKRSILSRPFFFKASVELLLLKILNSLLDRFWLKSSILKGKKSVIDITIWWIILISNSSSCVFWFCSINIVTSNIPSWIFYIGSNEIPFRSIPIDLPYRLKMAWLCFNLILWVKWIVKIVDSILLLFVNISRL